MANWEMADQEGTGGERVRGGLGSWFRSVARTWGWGMARSRHRRGTVGPPRRIRGESGEPAEGEECACGYLRRVGPRHGE